MNDYVLSMTDTTKYGGAFEMDAFSKMKRKRVIVYVKRGGVWTCYDCRFNYPWETHGDVSVAVGVDAKGLGSMPKTMEAYRMRGTPSTMILDKDGQLVHHHFGQVSEMQIGAQISALLAQPMQIDAETSKQKAHSGCDKDGCSL